MKNLRSWYRKERLNGPSKNESERESIVTQEISHIEKNQQSKCQERKESSSKIEHCLSSMVIIVCIINLTQVPFEQFSPPRNKKIETKRMIINFSLIYYFFDLFFFGSIRFFFSTLLTRNTLKAQI